VCQLLNCCSIYRCYEADSESEDGDFAQQIREQSSRIQKEIELERRLKTRQAQRVANQSVPITDSAGSGRSGYNSVDSRHHTQPRYRGSGSFTHLSSAQGLHAFHSYSASTPDMTNLFTAQQVILFAIHLPSVQLSNLNFKLFMPYCEIFHYNIQLKVL